jgi:hypothetical protein
VTSISPRREQDPVRVGPFRVVGRVGVGGMGQVFIGLDGERRAVALKVIRPDLADEAGFRERFAREIAVARRVRGRFVAPLVDADTDGSPPWLATGYLAGPTLAEALGSHGPLPVDAVVTLAAGLAEALTDLHAAGIVHRDLKPGNVILLDDGPRVIDFGVSRASDMSTMTHTGELIGSPGFLAPEQVEGDDDVGPASDVFALGALICFAATGTGPFGPGQTPALMYRVVHAAPDLGRVPEEIRGLVSDCLAKRPADRPTGAEVLSRLVAENGGGEAPARPDQTWLPAAVSADIARRDRDLDDLTAPDGPGPEPGPVAATEVRPRRGAAPAPPRPAGARARRNRRSAVAAIAAATVLMGAAMAYVILPGAQAQQGADLPVANRSSSAAEPSRSSAPFVPSVPSPPSERTAPSGTSVPTPPAPTTVTAPNAPPAPAPPAQTRTRPPTNIDPVPVPSLARAVPVEGSASPVTSACLRTAIAGGFELRTGTPVAGGPNYTSPVCGRIHIKLTGALYRTYARACLETPDGQTITACSDWILLSYPDTWDTFSVPVQGRTRWQLQMYSDGDESARFSYTA